MRHDCRRKPIAKARAIWPPRSKQTAISRACSPRSTPPAPISRMPGQSYRTPPGSTSEIAMRVSSLAIVAALLTCGCHREGETSEEEQLPPAAVTCAAAVETTIDDLIEVS